MTQVHVTVNKVGSCKMKFRRSVAGVAGLAVVASLLVVIAGPLAIQSSGACGPYRYRIYDQSNYGTPSRTMCFNQPNLQNEAYGSLPWQNFNNNISSVKNNFADSSNLRFYDDANYQNLLVSYGIGAKEPWVGSSLNDRFGSSYNGHAP